MTETIDILDEQKDLPIEAEVTTKDEVTQNTNETPKRDEIYQSVTSTGSGCAPFDEEWIAKNTAKAFRMAGIGTKKSDKILNGGNTGHYSGKAILLSDRYIEGEVLNSNKDDIGQAVTDKDTAKSITGVGSIPLGGIKIGQILREEYGDNFNPDKGFFAGDKLKDGLRLKLAEVGFEEVYEGYGTAEMGLMATEVDGIEHPNRVLMPLLDFYSLEIYPAGMGLNKRTGSCEFGNYGEVLREGPESISELVDIREIEEPTVGRVYPSRERVRRYDQKDAIEVIPGQELPQKWPDKIPGIKILGRLNGLTIGGPTVTEEDMEKVILDLANQEQNPEFHYSKVGDPVYPTMVVESTLDITQEQLYEAFDKYIPELNHALENDFINRIEYNKTSSMDLIRRKGMKVQRFSDDTES